MRIDKRCLGGQGVQGIGQAIAETLARRGANIIVADLQEEKAQTVAQQIAATTGKKAIAVKVDVSDSASAKAMFSRAISFSTSIIPGSMFHSAWCLI